MKRSRLAMLESPAKKRLSIWLEPSVIKKLDAEANARNVSRQRIMATAISDRYSDQSQEDRDALLARRLNRIDARQKVIDRELEIVAESFSLFLRMWLATSPDVPESQREAVQKLAQERHERFLASLGKRLASGRSILTELPRNVTLKAEDF